MNLNEMLQWVLILTLIVVVWNQMGAVSHLQELKLKELDDQISVYKAINVLYKSIETLQDSELKRIGLQKNKLEEELKRMEA